MTTIKLSALFDSTEALRQLSAMELPVRLAFRIKKSLKRIQQELDTANEVRNRVLEKYTEKDEKGKAAHPLDENGKPIHGQVKLTDPAAYHTEIEELMIQEVSMTLEELKSSDFGDKIEIKPAILHTLHWLFADE